MHDSKLFEFEFLLLKRKNKMVTRFRCVHPYPRYVYICFSIHPINTLCTDVAIEVEDNR
jgi:hypothetical protein